jgi:hypothetical protein
VRSLEGQIAPLFGTIFQLPHPDQTKRRFALDYQLPALSQLNVPYEIRLVVQPRSRPLVYLPVSVTLDEVRAAIADRSQILALAQALCQNLAACLAENDIDVGQNLAEICAPQPTGPYLNRRIYYFLG